MPDPDFSAALDTFVVRLFGPFCVEIGGEPMPRLRYRSSQWLLALLILRGSSPAERRRLAATLWPDSDETNALFYLRRSLTDLRHALGASAFRLVSPTPRTLRFDLKNADCDVTAFDAAIADGRDTALQTAVFLYRGSLLEGCEEEWVQEEQRMREHAFLAALETLGEQALNAHRYREAARHLKQLLARDPYREAAQCRLMETLAQMGDYAAVTVTFREFRLRLHHEMNAAPNAETVALYQRLHRPSSSAPSPSSAPLPAAPVSAPSPPSGFLPRPLTDLIGREEIINQIAEMLPRFRLLTLTGTGGVGKTRLAIAVGEAAVTAFTSGVWFVDLAALTDDALLEQTVAHVLDVREEADSPLAETLQRHLADKSLLLVLDNCEHLLDACAHLTLLLLEHCPHLRVLATSRQALGVTGERVLSILPLPLPDTNQRELRDKNSLTVLMESPAVRLFIARIADADSELRLDPPHVLLIAHICQHLDGIPLALELAAARVKSIGIEVLHSRLNDRFHLLTQGNRAALSRHQTLRALLDWSYDLLTPQEQTLLKRLAVFRGGWTLTAAEAIIVKAEAKIEPLAGREREEEKPSAIEDQNAAIRSSQTPLANGEVLNLLMSLLNQSLIVMEDNVMKNIVTEDIVPAEGGASPRYRLLETMRQYALEKLSQSELAEVQALHSDYYLRFAVEVRPHLAGQEQVKWFAVMDMELDNLRAALDTCEADTASPITHLQLAAAVSYFWWRKGYLREGRARLDQAFLRPEVQETMQARQEALNHAGLMAHNQADVEAAERYLEECFVIARKCENKPMMAKVLNNLGTVAKAREDFTAARQRYEASLEIKREIGNVRAIAIALHNLGNIAREEDAFGRAADFYQESFALFEELGDKQNSASSFSSQGRLAVSQGDYEKAQDLHRQGLTLQREFQDSFAIMYRLYDSVEIALLLHKYERAAYLLGAVDSLCDAFGIQVSPIDRKDISNIRASLQNELGIAGFEEAQAAGRLFSLDEAIDFALAN